MFSIMNKTRFLVGVAYTQNELHAHEFDVRTSVSSTVPSHPPLLPVEPRELTSVRHPHRDACPTNQVNFFPLPSSNVKAR
jgi:hypothetical protein